MPPKSDPYATPRARTFDLVLILLALVAIVILLYTAPRHRSDTGAISTFGLTTNN